MLNLVDETNIKVNEMIDKMNRKQMDSYMVSYRYEADINELILDSLARFIIGFCGESYKTNCSAFFFEKEPLTTDPNRMRINKVVMSANKLTNDMKVATKSVFKLLSGIDEETQDGKQKFLNEALVNFLQQFALTENKKKNKKKKKKDFSNIIKRMNENYSTNIVVKSKEGDYLLSTLKFISDISKNKYLTKLGIDSKQTYIDEILLILKYILDISVIFEIKKFYEFDFKDDLFDFLEENLENKESGKIHCESQIAIHCFKQNFQSGYIGCSKLCCPLCAKFLECMGFRFRGNHSSAVLGTRGWRLKAPSNQSESFSKCISGFQNFLKNLDTALENQSPDMHQISSLFKFNQLLNTNEPKWQIDPDLFDYGKKLENRSFDFDLIERFLKSTSTHDLIKLNDFRALFKRIYEPYTIICKHCISNIFKNFEVSIESVLLVILQL